MRKLNVQLNPSGQKAPGGSFAKEPLQPLRHDVRIRWGADPDARQGIVRYAFETEPELRAFLRGVEAASGWMDWEIVSDDEEIDND